jgi:hypothetical protein
MFVFFLFATRLGYVSACLHVYLTEYNSLNG